MGFLQVPIVLVADDSLGGSSAYVTMVSQWVVTKKLQEMFPYFAKYRCGLANWWQVGVASLLMRCMFSVDTVSCCLWVWPKYFMSSPD